MPGGRSMASQSLATTDFSASRTKLSNSDLGRAGCIDPRRAWMPDASFARSCQADHPTFTRNQSHSSPEPEQAPAVSHSSGPKSARTTQDVLAPLCLVSWGISRPLSSRRLSGLNFGPPYQGLRSRLLRLSVERLPEISDLSARGHSA